MTAQGQGSIINIASINGISPAPLQVVYSMTKAAVISLTKGLAKEVGAQGVRVNAIAPGLVETHFAQALIDNPAIHKEVVAMTPLNRHAQPEEIVGAALYLASDAASFTTGSVIVCDGGATA
jgi:NAD(P)-dependent dehydrogenase (short-subunit alcohol dehydrogenase family)